MSEPVAFHVTTRMKFESAFQQMLSIRKRRNLQTELLLVGLASRVGPMSGMTKATGRLPGSAISVAFASLQSNETNQVQRPAPRPLEVCLT